jgi:hypothetical protein
MADERNEDLSELEGDAVHDRIRELMEEGWKPVTLTMRRDEEQREDRDPVLRDELRF